MTLLEHLLALKDHLVRIAIALIVSSAASFVLATRIFEWLLVPVADHQDKVSIMANTPTSAISTYVKIAFFSGAILAMPSIVYQVLLYVLPALTRKEKRIPWDIAAYVKAFDCGIPSNRKVAGMLEVLRSIC